MSVIAWTVGSGSIMFALGLISAVGSRRQHKAKTHITPLIYDATLEQELLTGIKKGAKATTAMSMAASGGQLNGEEEFASIGNHSR